MAVSDTRSERRERVEQVFASLPERYLGAEDGFEATYQVILGDLGRRWEIQVSPARCTVRPAPTRRPDVVIGTDSDTWLALREGRLSGVDAFARRLLYARGDLDLAMGFEGLFRLPDDRPPLLRMHEVRVRDARISTVTAGQGPRHAILLHGLGSSKASFFETISTLAERYRVHAIDLPGFGSSSKPLMARYDARYFARAVLRFMDALAIDSAHVVGNSMGGRVALEMALSKPARVRGLGLLAPALAFRRGREWAPLVRVLRPELAAIPHPARESIVRGRLYSMFADPGRLDPATADVVTDEFLRTYRQHAARVALAKSARNIYLERPFGRDGFWTRLPSLERPALFVWGAQDTLVPAGFGRHVAEAVPDAEQITLDNCGHVPQVEHPERTSGALRRFLAEVDATAGRRPATRRPSRVAEARTGRLAGHGG